MRWMDLPFGVGGGKRLAGSTHAGLPLPSGAKYMPDWQKLARVSAHASEFLPQLMY